VDGFEILGDKVVQCIVLSVVVDRVGREL
jgi:hypothetical protein